MNTKDIAATPEPMKILTWGPSGTGKTHLIGTAAKLGMKVYVFDFDYRLAGLAGLDIEYDRYRDTNPKQPRAFDQAYSKLEKLEAMKPFPFDLVALDSLSTIAIAAMNKSLIATGSFMPKLSRMGDGKIEIPVKQDYQGLMHFTETFIVKLVSLPCHVIVTAHEDNDKDPITERTYKNLAISGKLAGRLPQYFNEIWRATIDPIAGSDGKPKPVFKIVTRPDHIYMARTLYPDALLIKEEPDLRIIYPKIETYLKGMISKVAVSAPPQVAAAPTQQAAKTASAFDTLKA